MLKDKLQSLESHESYNYGLRQEDISALDLSIESSDYKSLNEVLIRLHPADIADYINSCSGEIRKKIIDFLLEDFFIPELLLYIDYHFLVSVLYQICVERSASIISQLELDDELYVIENLNSEMQNSIIEFLPESKKHILKELLSYPANTAGRIMKPKMITAMEYWTVSQTIDYLRKNQTNYSEVSVLYVLDLKHKPIGIVNTSKLIYSNSNDILRKIVDEDFKTVRTDQDQEEVSILFKQYQLLSAPVVNKEGRIVGVITIDDIIDVVVEEAEEDILKMGGLQEDDLNLSFFSSAKKRIPWLMVNFVTSLITVYIIRLFDDTIENMVILASIMPIVASLGGNAGTQTLTIIIRLISMRDVSNINSYKIVQKEAATCILNGILIGIVGGFLIFGLNHNVNLSIVFASAIIFNFFVAGFMGSFIPFALKRCGLDPALSSSIFLTACTDIVGFFGFLLLANKLL